MTAMRSEDGVASTGEDGSLPRSVEQLLALAAVDPRFAARLLDDPLTAAEDRALTLSASERALLAALPRAALQQMIDAFAERIPEPERRRFLGQSAAAVLAGALLAGSDRCGGEPARHIGTETGSRPHRPPPRREPKPAAASQPCAGSGSSRGKGGIRPDRPTTTGVRPDRP